MIYLALSQTTPDLGGWSQIAERWGLPVALMIAMGVGVFLLSRKAMAIAEKLATSHIELIDALKGILPSLKGRAEQTGEKLEEIQDNLRELKDELRRIRP